MSRHGMAGRWACMGRWAGRAGRAGRHAGGIARVGRAGQAAGAGGTGVRTLGAHGSAGQAASARQGAAGARQGAAGERVDARARGMGPGRAWPGCWVRGLCARAGPVGCSCTRLGFQPGFSTRYFSRFTK